MAWEPIETAPKDGTYVLVWPGIWYGIPVSVAVYDYDRHAKNPRPYWRRIDDMGRVSMSRGKTPELWQPLPNTPHEKTA